jgi:hypothetical protein
VLDERAVAVLEREGWGWKKKPRGIFTPAPCFYRLTAGAEIPALGAEFPAPGISGVSDGISGGGNLTFLPKFLGKISAPCSGKCTTSWKYMEARNFAQEIRVSTLWKNCITCTRKVRPSHQEPR